MRLAVLMNIEMHQRLRYKTLLLPITFAFVIALSPSADAALLNVSLPSVEPQLPAGQRNLLGDLVAAVLEGGSTVVDPSGRNQLEADSAALNRTVIERSLTATTATATVLQQAAGSSGQMAVSQPLAPLDACLVWRRRLSTTFGSATARRDGLYFVTLFHSSVWSMLLLCLMVVVSLLTVFEAAHPIGMRSATAAALKRRARRRPGGGGSGDKPMGSFHALAFSTGALLLLGYPRSPKSTAGRVLALTWWLFGFAIAVAYVAATVLMFLTTRADPEAAMPAGLSEILQQTAMPGRTVLCAAGTPLCADWARPGALARANVTGVAGEAAGLERLRQGEPGLLMLTHQFACANLLAGSEAGNFSVALVARSVGWVGLAGAADLVRLADARIARLMGAGQLAGLSRLHGIDSLEVYRSGESGSSSGGSGGDLLIEWLTELRQGLPYRIGSLYGPLVLLMVGIGLALCVSMAEFAYYRFYYELPELDDDEEAEFEDALAVQMSRKNTGLSAVNTMDTYL